jgi:hypothetical protein
MTSTLILQRLQHEWSTLSTRRATLARVGAWQLVSGPLSSLDQLLMLMGRGDGPRSGGRHNRRRPTAQGVCDGASWGADPVAEALIHRARHDDLAARIVLQRLVPGLMALAEQHGHGRRRAEITDELVSAAWTVIRTFESGDNPRFLVSRLVRACEYQVFEKGQRRKLRTESTDDDRFAGLRAPEHSEALHELADVVADARTSGAINDADVRFLARYVTSNTAQDLAAQLCVTPRTIRNRRDAIVYRLRAQVAAANAA